jgi:hypothetical protein
MTGKAAACVDRSCLDMRSEALLAAKIQNISKSGEEGGKTGVLTLFEDIFFKNLLKMVDIGIAVQG